MNSVNISEHNSFINGNNHLQHQQKSQQQLSIGGELKGGKHISRKKIQNQKTNAKNKAGHWIEIPFSEYDCVQSWVGVGFYCCSKHDAKQK